MRQHFGEGNLSVQRPLLLVALCLQSFLLLLASPVLCGTTIVNVSSLGYEYQCSLFVLNNSVDLSWSRPVLVNESITVDSPFDASQAVTSGLVISPFQPTQNTPLKIVYRRCFDINVVNLSLAERVRTIKPAIAAEDTLTQLRSCVAACLALGRYRTQRDVLFRSMVQNIDDPNCYCATVDRIAAGNAKAARLTEADLCWGNGDLLQFRVEAYCATHRFGGNTSAVTNVSCNSGCQVRGPLQCCVPGTLVPPAFTRVLTALLANKSTAPVMLPSDDDSSLNNALRWAIIATAVFGVVEGIGFVLLRGYWKYFRKKHSSSLNSQGGLEKLLSPGACRSDVESEMLATTVLEAKFGRESDAARSQYEFDSTLSELTRILLENDMLKSKGRNSANDASPAKGDEIGRELCPICLDAASGASGPSWSLVEIEHCGHIVHRTCLRDYLKHKLQSGAALKCPVYGCRRLVSDLGD